MSEARPTPNGHTTGADAERDRLHARLRASYARTAAAGVTLAKLVQRAASETDLVAHYGTVVATILALEELKAVAEQAAKDLRGAVMASFLDTSCPSISTDAFTAFLQREPSFLDIVDPKAIPTDLWTQPEPEPDKRKIKAAIEAGRAVPGASITARNSSRLVIRGKSS